MSLGIQFAGVIGMCLVYELFVDHTINVIIIHVIITGNACCFVIFILLTHII